MARTKEGNGDPFEPLWMLAHQVQKKSDTKSENNADQNTEDDLHLRRLGCRRRRVRFLLSLRYAPNLQAYITVMTVILAGTLQLHYSPQQCDKSVKTDCHSQYSH